MMGKSKKKKKSSVFPAILLLLCTGLLLVSLWQLYTRYREYKKGSEEYRELLEAVQLSPKDGEQLYRVSLEELKRQNPDTVAWIQIPDTRICYPVMQTVNDEYYLDHTFSGQVHKAGSIFMEALNTPDFTDVNTVLYGHNMRDGSMFAGLSRYRDGEYRRKHPNVYVELEDGMHVYEIFACYETRVGSEAYEILFDGEEEIAEWIKRMKKASYDTGVDPDPGDRILTLSTCAKSENRRFVVQAREKLIN